jgi:hypoxanthine-DNA glycosylase
MGELFGVKPSLPYEQRVLRLEAAGVALWDSLQACARRGSLDGSITSEMVNDFETFFGRYPAITHVFFNGLKSETAFRRGTLPCLQDGRHVFTRLPSSSPAHAGMSFEAKVQAWSVVKVVLS